MAILKGATGDIRRNSFRGKYYLSSYRGKIVLKKWPDKRPGPMSPKQQAASDKFAQAALATKYMTATAQETARIMSKGTNGLPRDYLMMALYGRLGYVVNIGGRNLFAMASRDQVSLILDAIAQDQNSVLMRGEQYWEPVAPGSPADVLTIQLDGSIAWQAGGSGGGLPTKLGHTNFDPLTATTYSSGFWRGIAVLGVGAQAMNAVEFWAYAASGGAICTPAIYADDNNAPGALIQSGPPVSGVSLGLNRLPLTAPATFGAGNLYWVGFQLTGAAIQLVQAVDPPRPAYFSSTGSIPDPAPSVAVSSVHGAPIWAAQ